MHHRTVLLTGATSGIGRETARGLASAGATLILACRDQARRGWPVRAFRAGPTAAN